MKRARKTGQDWGVPVRERVIGKMENQTKLLPPSLQASVAISRPHLEMAVSCLGSDCGNRPYLGHLLLACHLTCGLLTNCLAHNINMLIDWGEGWPVYGVGQHPQKIQANFQADFLCHHDFITNKQPCCYSPDQHGWGAACTHWTNMLINWTLFLWLYVSLRDRVMRKKCRVKPLSKNFCTTQNVAIAFSWQTIVTLMNMNL